MEVVLEKLAEEVPDFFANFGERKITQAILRANTNTKADFDKSSSVNTIRSVLGDLSRLKEAKRKKTSPLVEV